MDGNKVLAKTLNNIFFQRATSFIGTPDMNNYTMQADVMTDGNRRMKSEVGLINQRYLIALQGNANEIDVSSNQERLKASRALHHHSQKVVHPENPRGRQSRRQRCHKRQGMEQRRAGAGEMDH